MGISIMENEDVEFPGRSKINSMIVSNDPDWAAKDADISIELVRLFILEASKTKIRDMRFSIAERSDDEKDPHYLIDASTGEELNEDVPSTNLDIDYEASERENFHLGEIKLFIRFKGTEEQRDFIGRILLEEYIKLLSSYYPEFETVYFETDKENNHIPYQYLLK